MVDVAKVLKVLKLWVPMLIASTQLLEKLWHALNQEQRVTVRAKQLFARVHKAASAKDPAARLAGQLDAIDAYLVDGHQLTDEVNGWRSESVRARKLLMLAGAMSPRQKTQSLRDLDAAVGLLFAAIMMTDAIQATSQESTQLGVNAAGELT